MFIEELTLSTFIYLASLKNILDKYSTKQ